MKPILNIKKWLNEQNEKNEQFKFVSYPYVVIRKKDGYIFKLGPTKYSTADGIWHIKAFHLDKIHVDVWIPEKTETLTKWSINDIPFLFCLPKTSTTN